MKGADDRAAWKLPGYIHIRELGAGAGGSVWLTRRAHDGSTAAVKYLASRLHHADDFREAYRSEARLLAELDSPHIVRLHEYVESDEGCAIVMEAVEGTSLRTILREREEGGMAPEAALCILKGSLLGLADAHDADIVHRDYKPANVLVTPEGVSKLADFGLATRSGDVALTAGTPLYMAPEQFHGTPASPSGDVYAATVTFFECVTGTRPYPGANAVELMAQHSFGDIPDESAPEAVRPLIRAGMAKEPADRPESARAFLADLERVAVQGYGEDWERNGRRALVALLGLVPLLLLETAAQALPTAATSSAVPEATGATAHGAANGAVNGGATNSAANGGAAEGSPHGEGWLRHTKRRSVQASVVAVAAAAAATAFAISGASTPHAAAASSTGSAGTSAAGASAQPASSAAAGASTGSGGPTSGTAAGTGGAPSTGPATPGASASSSTDPSASSTASASPSSTASPVISSLQISSLTCGTTKPTLDAAVSVTSNGQGGQLVFSWFYQDSILSPRTYLADPTKVALTPGKTQQVVSPSVPEDYSAHADATFWGVSVTSVPAAPSGAQAETLKVGGGCFL